MAAPERAPFLAIESTLVGFGELQIIVTGVGLIPLPKKDLYRDHLIPGFVSARTIPTREAAAKGGEKTADTGGGVHELPISYAKPNELPVSELKHENVAETYVLPP